MAPDTEVMPASDTEFTSCSPGGLLRKSRGHHGAKEPCAPGSKGGPPSTAFLPPNDGQVMGCSACLYMPSCAEPGAHALVKMVSMHLGGAPPTHDAATSSAYRLLRYM